MHDLTADALRAKYGDRFQYRRKGVDFFDNLTKKLIELTTPGQVRSHKNRGGDYKTCEYGTYRFPR